MSSPFLFLLNLSRSKGPEQGHTGSERVAEKQQLGLLKISAVVGLSRGQKRVALTRRCESERKATSCDLGSQPGVWTLSSLALETTGGSVLRKGLCEGTERTFPRPFLVAFLCGSIMLWKHNQSGI